ncbi:NAD-dependent epimerase/dehydratase family protein [Homoserinimonas sp. A447]
MTSERAGRRVYVTGGNGFLGSSVVAGLAAQLGVGVDLVVSGDLREPPTRVDGVVYETADVTQANDLLEQFQRHKINTVVHLAAVVNPGRDLSREDEYRVDVEGSRNVLDACLATGVRRIVVSSSGAAYGYHADNPAWLVETNSIRGNESFSYSHHKRLVELMLEEARVWHPELEQVVFRISTILGETVDNQVTALFRKKRLLRVSGSESPFVFAWDQDVVAAMARAATDGPPGVYNLTGDGALTVRELARLMGKKTVTVQPWMLKLGLWAGQAIGATAHGPEQAKFLQFRPVLLNTKLKQEFGYTPKHTSRQAFEAWLASRS